MLIRAGYELKFRAPAPVAMVLMLSTHPSRSATVSGERLMTDPEVKVTDFLDLYGNRCARIVAPAGELTLSNDFTVTDSGELDEADLDASQAKVEDLPEDILHFLLASRYCEVDRLSHLAWQLFGDSPPGFRRVQAVCSWVHSQVEFGYHHALNTKSAWDVLGVKNGVCRDFTHLAVAFCRALNIPARYCTGYLGDFGVPPSETPMDFSAWFDVYLGGRWFTFDARHNRRRIGRILMARGRDAVDVALTTQFGPAELIGFKVWTDEIDSTNPSSNQARVPSAV